MRGRGHITEPTFLLLYASEKGTAQGIAEDLYEQLIAKGLKGELKCCGDIDNEFLKTKVTCLVVVASTTGDGEPPDTARKLWRGLNRKTTTTTTTTSTSTTITNSPTSTPSTTITTTKPNISTSTKPTTSTSTSTNTTTSTSGSIPTIVNTPTSTTSSSTTTTSISTINSTTSISTNTSTPSTNTTTINTPSTSNSTTPTNISTINSTTSIPTTVPSSSTTPSTATNSQSPVCSSSTPLTNLSYTVLGLGDTNYNNFCNFGKSLDRKLHQLGAQRFYECGWADDGTGLEEVVEPWIEGLLPALTAHLATPRHNNHTTTYLNNHTTADHLNHNTTDQGTRGQVTEKEGVIVERNSIGGDRINNGKEGTLEKNPEVRIENMEEGDSRNNNVNQRKGIERIENVSGNRNSVDMVSYVDEWTSSKDQTSDSVDFQATSALNMNQNSEVMVNQSANHSDQFVIEETSTTKLESKDPVVSIVARYGVDILPWSEIKELPLRSCAFPLDSKLTLPVLPPGYLTITYMEDDQSISEVPCSAPYPSAASKPIHTHLKSINKLTRHDAVKTTLEVTLGLPAESNSKFEYEPGDSFGVVVRNPKLDVEILLHLLGERADMVCEIAVLADTKKRSAAVPGFIPTRSTIGEILERCIDIRSVPKKPLLRRLLEDAEDELEKRRLQELVSKEGMAEYNQYVRGANLSILDLFLAFRSCRPPLVPLLEHLPRLLPRPYSAISSPLVDPSQVAFAFNIIEIPKAGSVTFTRRGICTGWLASLMNETSSDEKVNQSMEKLSIKNQNSCTEPTKDQSAFTDTSIMDQKIKNTCTVSSRIEPNPRIDIYLRTNLNFRLPRSPTAPIIMVGPGTGVAPFVGFLRHREKMAYMNSDMKFGESWLFYGCRHCARDYLYQDELERYRDSNILSRLVVSFSRDGESGEGPKYVQDNIAIHKEALSKLLMDPETWVYVCGDARNMAKDVFEGFVSVLAASDIPGDLKPREYLAQMQIQRRYLQDVWS